MNKYAQLRVTLTGDGFVPDRLPWIKLFLLVSLSALFSWAHLGLFAPIPLSLAFLLYDRKYCVILCLIALLLMGLFVSPPDGLYLVASFFGACVFASVMTVAIKRGLHPTRALMFSGHTLVLGLLIALSLLFLFTGLDPYQEINRLVGESLNTFRESNKELLSTGSPEMGGLKEIVNNPEAITNTIVRWSFSFVFVSVFLTFWIGFIALLKNAAAWKPYLNRPYFYSHKDLLRFRLNEKYVYLLITGLVLYVGQDFLGLSPFYEIVGGNILVCLSFFYFLQGLGILLDFLTYFKVHKIMKIITAILMAIVAWRVLVVVGVFDLWFKFRRFLYSRKNHKGARK